MTKSAANFARTGDIKDYKETGDIKLSAKETLDNNSMQTYKFTL